ncbi:MAG: TetR family transcriptional regulator [Anaerolineae bacterium]|nr:TetR family transcriptional regulator [Anaerolineae bacterium]
MNDSVLTAERIIDAAEDVLRRYGPDKATVVDVARALGVSHGSVYRHFPSKAALRDAVAERWLEGVSSPLESIVDEDGPAPERLHRWFDTLIATKRGRAQDDPELFANYLQLATEAREVIVRHVETLVSQLTRIIADGVARGEFHVADPAVAARATLHATVRFHDPVHAAQWSDPNIDAAFEAVWVFVLAGLGAS